MAARFWVGGTGTWDASNTANWAATSGGAGGQTVPGAADTVTIDANSGTGTITVNTNFTVTSITSGAMNMTLDFATNNNSPTMNTFNCSGTGTRTLNMGSGTWSIAGNNALVWTTATATNLTFNSGTSTLNFTYSGAVGNRSVSANIALQYYNVNITAGSDTFSFGTSLMVNGSFNTTGYTGALSFNSGTVSIGGNLTWGTGSTVTTGTQTIIFNGTAGTQTVTSNGVQVNHPFNINTTGSAVVLADAFDMDGANARTLTLTAGNFNSNGQSVTAAVFSSSNSNTRSLTMGASTWTLTSTGTVWNITNATGMTLSAGTSTITANNATATSKTFAFNAMTYYNLVLTGAGTGTFILGVSTATTTFNNITVSTPPHTVQIFAGKTLNVQTITWDGTAGNLNTFQSTLNGTPWYLVGSNLINNEQYISLQDSYASNGVFNAFISTDAGNNRGWNFINSAADSMTALLDDNSMQSMIAVFKDDGESIVRVAANPTNHGLSVDDNTTGTNNGGGTAELDENSRFTLYAESSAGDGSLVALYVDKDGKLLIDSN